MWYGIFQSKLPKNLYLSDGKTGHLIEIGRPVKLPKGSKLLTEFIVCDGCGDVLKESIGRKNYDWNLCDACMDLQSGAR